MPGCEIVAACDTDELMAGQLADRFHVPTVFTDAGRMLQEAKPDAVHITTPAQSHFPLGRMCLEAGCHVYMEKPFAETAAETDILLRLAAEKRLHITVGHNLQFNPEAVRMRELVKSGFLGGPPIHMEAVQCYSHDDPTYGRIVLADPNHWVRRLPGSLSQNLISHGISKLAEFLTGDDPRIISLSFSSPYPEWPGTHRRRGRGPRDHSGRAGDHRVLPLHHAVRHRQQRAAPVRKVGRTWSWTTPTGPSSAISPSGYKSYMRYFFAPWTDAREQLRNSSRNMKLFVRNDFHMDYGMKKLMQTVLRRRPGRQARSHPCRGDPEDRQDHGDDLPADAGASVPDEPPAVSSEAVRYLILSDIPTPWRDRLRAGLEGPREGRPGGLFQGNEKRRLWSFGQGEHPQVHPAEPDDHHRRHGAVLQPRHRAAPAPSIGPAGRSSHDLHQGPVVLAGDGLC
ncbi:MAG: Gfo/Idh/MocA family oxidoreductase [Candidatus Moduliflexus flocculans]|nr:Gfo/Idh/MocA family oxidoreductase [Candidatus Moduliflexus flocculans]